jgi:hypothetical protein
VLSDWAAIGKAFPGASVVASTLDEFLPHLEAAAPALPLVTAEIGDTWVHGAASDPQKLAFLRAAGRAVEACLAPGGGCDPADAAFRNATRFVIKNFVSGRDGVGQLAVRAGGESGAGENGGMRR